jgi:hypothetical protein
MVAAHVQAVAEPASSELDLEVRQRLEEEP